MRTTRQTSNVVEIFANDTFGHIFWTRWTKYCANQKSSYKAVHFSNSTRSKIDNKRIYRNFLLTWVQVWNVWKDRVQYEKPKESKVGDYSCMNNFSFINNSRHGGPWNIILCPNIFLIWIRAKFRELNIFVMKLFAGGQSCHQVISSCDEQLK